MILNKYNEIMDHITIDPEMKSRVMNAVSTSIREQAEGAAIVTEIHPSGKTEYTKTRTGKKAKKTPIIIISSVAAAVLVLLGALFIFRIMGSSATKSMDTNGDLHLDGVDMVANDTEAAEEMEETTSQKSVGYSDDKPIFEAPGQGSSDNQNYSATTNKDTVAGVDFDSRGTIDINTDVTDVRVVNIGNTLPFDLKGNGTGKLADGITTEVFLGVDGQKVVLYSADAGTDLVKNFDPSNRSAGQTATSPMGTEVKLLRVAFGNVTDPADGETSTDVNAALFTRDGHTYLLIFSDFQSADIILGVVDAV